MLPMTLLPSAAAELVVTSAERWCWHFLGMGTGETFKNVASGLGSIVTASAVIVGGWWAWFKFLKGRTYKPRLSVHMAGQWRDVKREPTFHVRIRITNIGASKVSLRQSGTGLRISLPADKQAQFPGSFNWEPLLTNAAPGQPQQKRTFVIFKEHKWIEPGETISDDILINLVREPTTVMLETRLVWSLSERDTSDIKHNVVVFARQIVPPESKIDDNFPQQPKSG